MGEEHLTWGDIVELVEKGEINRDDIVMVYDLNDGSTREADLIEFDDEPGFVYIIIDSAE